MAHGVSHADLQCVTGRPRYPGRVNGLGGARRRARRRRVLTGILASGISVLAAGCGSSGGHVAAPAGQLRPAATTATPGADSPGATAAATASATASPGPGQPTVIPVPPPPGRLHQTRTLPSAGTRVFRAEMTDLWAAVATGHARLAAQAFFPLTAYTQVKAIANPAADWNSRLFGDFRLDVAAAHHFLGGGARHATLVRVIVPSAGAAWISPGGCANAVGYWHVGGARLVYRQHGQVRSIGIASLISWRGRWYVVHFGAVLRGGAGGVVDAPATGPGVPGPAGGC
ncbi:MAG: hypothetical protein QOG05_4961 [Streptosporangiaceae bacterium]|nr:hypothetical protein [Streptosporangiaceae bacterium]